MFRELKRTCFVTVNINFLTYSQTERKTSFDQSLKYLSDADTTQGHGLSDR